MQKKHEIDLVKSHSSYLITNKSRTFKTYEDIKFPLQNTGQNFSGGGGVGPGDMGPNTFCLMTKIAWH